MASVFLQTDLACWTEQKLQKGMTGGTESFFMRLREWLITSHHDVYDPVLRPKTGKIDLCIHSNTFDESIKAKRHLLWAGSFHASTSDPRPDKIVIVSEYMKNKMGCDRATVIPAPYGADVDRFKNMPFLRHHISSTSNPNRYFPHALKVMKILKDDLNLNFQWTIVGGNKLYADNYPECHNFNEGGFAYRGIVPRLEVIGVLTSSQIWAYPNFTDDSETLCCSMLEAAALGISVVVPKREPFISVLPSAFFAEDEEHFAAIIHSLFECGKMDYPEIDGFSERSVMPRLLTEIEELL
jgi:hypothetical protein